MIMRKVNSAISSLMLLLLMLFSSCDLFNNTPQLSDEEKYELAIQDAMIAEEDEICIDLIAITDTNSYIIWSGTENDKKVLVVTWTKYPESYPENDTISNTWGEIWVTVVPEMEDWFLANYSTGSNYVTRTEELLGLPRDKGYTYFVEMWVDPDDLWRPSPDNEITDTSADLDIPTDIDSTYQVWYNENIIYSYFPMRYPWTRLGYTYDWGSSTTEIGLSEFVIKKNSQIIVYKVYDNESYFENIFNPL
jgi:hypothetical protein